MNEMAPATDRHNRCAQRLAERGARDDFLTQADQRPELDELLIKLDKDLAKFEQGARANVKKITDELRAGISGLEKSLRELRAHLVEDFAPLKIQPVDGTALQKTAQSLYHQVEYLSRRVRHRMLRVLDRLAPRHQLISKLIAELEAAKQTEIDVLPEGLRLIVPRRAHLPYVPGQNLLELAYRPRLERICAHRSFRRMRAFLYRRRLRRLYRLLEVPIQDMAQDALVLRTELSRSKLAKRHEATHTELEAQLNDTWRALRYNVETVAVELDDLANLPEVERESVVGQKVTELESMLLSAVDKGLETLGETPVVYSTVLEGVFGELGQDRTNAIQAIREGVAQAASLRGRLRWARKSLRKQAKLRLKQLRALAQRGWPIVAGAWRFVHERAQRVAFSVRHFLGIAEIAEETLLGLTDLPPSDEVLNRARALPPIYRRLFSAEPLINREFLVGRDAQFESLQDALTRWQSGRAANVAIIGPEGSGKTSLINCFEYELDPAIEVVHINMNRRLRTVEDVIKLLSDALEIKEPCFTLSELEKALLNLPKRIIVVEQCHLIHLRAVGTRQAPEAFFHVIMATRAHLLWITSFRHFPWTRLEYLFDAERHYTHVVHTGFHKEDELREALLRRQRAAGQALLFSDQGSPSKQVAKLRVSYAMESPPVQAALEQDFFATLFRVTGGNMEAALFFWLLSLRTDSNARTLTMPCLKLDDRFISGLDRVYHFSLAEILGHGSLTPTEHAEIFRIEPEASRQILEYLRHLRLVDAHGRDKQGQAEYYNVSSVFHHTASAVLINLNILH